MAGYKGNREKCINLRMEGLTIKEISKIVGIMPGTVRWYLLGVHKPKPEVSIKDQIAHLIIKEGLSTKEVANRLGISRRTVYTYTPEINLPKKENPVKEKVLQMRRDGIAVMDIASKLGISKQSIVSYSRGYKFKRVGGYTGGRPKSNKPSKALKRVKREERPLVLREDRDLGKAVTVIYQGFGSKQKVVIKVRDENLTAEEAGKRWCNRVNKQYIESYYYG